MKFADSIRSGRISQADAVMAMKSTIWKSLEFLMATTSLSKQQWDTIIRPILLEGLPKMSANQNFPRDIVFAPEKLQGFNFQHPSWLQVIKQVQLLFLHLEDNNPTSKLLLAEWEALVEVSGWRNTTKPWPWKIINQYVPNTWLGKLLEHAQDLRMEIHLPLHGLQPREKDIPVMELFWNSAIPVGDLRFLNKVQMSKEVVWLSDLVVAHGN